MAGPIPRGPDHTGAPAGASGKIGRGPDVVGSARCREDRDRRRNHRRDVQAGKSDRQAARRHGRRRGPDDAEGHGRPRGAQCLGSGRQPEAGGAARGHDHLGRHPLPSERHPRRAGRGWRRGALPDRRRAAAGPGKFAPGPAAADLAHQDHVITRHRRPAAAAGRPRACCRQRPAYRPPRLDAPAQLGEKVVIRILDSRATVKSLESLGLNPGEADAIKRLLENHEGILLVTGPTGSGKTTTLYSAINQIKSEGVNIVTVEDPVEYRMQGIVQVQVQEKAGLTFAAALRSILRQDPNVVLVGEIRDKETAQIAVQASLTGHLVLSTLHTNDAANAVTRLVDIGVEAYKIAAALRGVVAQRLMRRLCPTCKEVWMETPPDRLKPWIPKGTPLYRAAGCPDCAMTGYRGRFSI